MNELVLSVVAPAKLGPDLIDQFLSGLKSFVPEDGIVDNFQSEVEKVEKPLTHEFIIQKVTSAQSSQK